MMNIKERTQFKYMAKNNSRLDIFDPQMNELLGILIGDGWIGIYGTPRRRKQVCFCGNLNNPRLKAWDFSANSKER